MKIKFALGPYGYEVVLGNITEEIYNKFSQDNDALRDAVTGFEENSDIKEWSDMDDIAHNYGAVLEEEGTDQYLKIFNENNDELLNIPLTLSNTTEASSPALSVICLKGDSIALRAMLIPTFWSSLSPSRPSISCWALTSATPPPATTPSSTAALVE